MSNFIEQIPSRSHPHVGRLVNQHESGDDEKPEENEVEFLSDSFVKSLAFDTDQPTDLAESYTSASANSPMDAPMNTTDTTVESMLKTSPTIISVVNETGECLSTHEHVAKHPDMHTQEGEIIDCAKTVEELSPNKPGVHMLVADTENNSENTFEYQRLHEANSNPEKDMSLRELLNEKTKQYTEVIERHEPVSDATRNGIRNVFKTLQNEQIKHYVESGDSVDQTVAPLAEHVDPDTIIEVDDHGCCNNPLTIVENSKTSHNQHTTSPVNMLPKQHKCKYTLSGATSFEIVSEDTFGSQFINDPVVVGVSSAALLYLGYHFLYKKK